MTGTPQTIRIDWRGITVEIRYQPNWLHFHEEIFGTPLAHLEVESVVPAKAELPFTETGYRSHFCSPADIEEKGGPEAFVRAWLDHEASRRAWKDRQDAARQMSLF